MAQSSEWLAMQRELKKSVVPALRKAGFSGSFPHFRRFRDGKAEMISFLSHSIIGGAFEVGASILFMDAADPQRTNLFYPNIEVRPDKLTWAHGRIRHGLPGFFDGGFYYVDVYAKNIGRTERGTDKRYEGIHYTAVRPNDKKRLEHLAENGFALVQKADESTYSRVAQAVSEQMKELLSWFDQIKNYEDLWDFHMRKIQGMR